MQMQPLSSYTFNQAASIKVFSNIKSRLHGLQKSFVDQNSNCLWSKNKNFERYFNFFCGTQFGKPLLGNKRLTFFSVHDLIVIG